MNSKHGDTYLKLYISESGSFNPAFLELSILHALLQIPNRPELLYMRGKSVRPVARIRLLHVA